MVRTRVGYTGGRRKNPTYHHMGDHTESLQIDFDPLIISYEELLELFWKSHNPESASLARQYMAAVFYHDRKQKEAAEKSRDRLAETRQRGVHTQILPLETFYLAENYHQKYYLRRTPALAKEFKALYPSKSDFIRSTAVARVNGYLGGHGTPEQFAAEIDTLGLSSEAQKKLRKSVFVSKR